MNRTFKALPCFALLLAILSSSGCVIPDDSRARFDSAHWHFLGERYDEALVDFNSIIGSPPESVPADLLARCYQFRGECYFLLRRFSLARFDLQDACKTAEPLGALFPEGPSLILECSMKIGDAYMMEESYRTADREYASLITSDPPQEFRDALLYRRYLCALKIPNSDPEQYLKQISNMQSFNAAKLKQELLGQAGASPPFSPPSPDSWKSSRFVLIPRSSWNASPVKSNINRMTKITCITVHHTSDAWENTGFSATADKILSYQKYHQENEERGYADIAYHFLVDRAGRVWEGRSLKYQGAHAGTFQLNRGNIGISVLGNYNSQLLNEDQKETLEILLANLCRRNGIPPRKIYTHQELKSTACPGSNLQKFISQLRNRSRP